MVLLLPVTAAVAVCKPAEDLVREAAEGAATRVVAAAALLAAKQCVHGHALRAEGRGCQRGEERAHGIRRQRRPGKGLWAYTKAPIAVWTIAINAPRTASLVRHDRLQ